jgi:hypothetical protein
VSTCHGYCITCVIDSDDLLLSMTISMVKREFRLSLKTIRALPTCLSLPGQYNESERTYPRRMNLFRTGAIDHGHQKGTAKLLHGVTPQARTAEHTLLPPLLQGAASQQVHRRWDGYWQNPHRSMPIVTFPAPDHRVRKLDWGVSCQGLRLGRPRQEPWILPLEHFILCCSAI